MKVKVKTLSAALAFLVCFSTNSGFVFAETEAVGGTKQFSDLSGLDASKKSKFDELIAAGIFNGISEDTFGLKQNMTRAQFAKVASLVFGLKADSNVKVSKFKDVQADDPANGYAL